MEPGTWTDHGVLPLPIHNIKGSDPDYNLIDANLLTNANDTYFHLSFGSYFDGIYQIRLSSPLEIAPIPALTHLAQNETKRPDNLPLDPIEGSYQFKWNVPGHGWQHFLFFSSGTCCRGVLSVPQGEEYKVMVCRSASGPGPEGPYVDKNGRSCLEGGGTEILASHSGVFAPGGQGVYFDESVGVGGSVILYYHYRKCHSDPR
jgi:arabinan endo-1,5-alpha-L-arabinosidase